MANLAWLLGSVVSGTAGTGSICSGLGTNSGAVGFREAAGAGAGVGVTDAELGLTDATLEAVGVVRLIGTMVLGIEV